MNRHKEAGRNAHGNSGYTSLHFHAAKLVSNHCWASEGVEELSPTVPTMAELADMMVAEAM